MQARASRLEQERSSGFGKPQTVLGSRRSPQNRFTESSTQIRLRLQIPAQCRQEPIISHLTAQHSLSVNITAARLSPNLQEDGWFDLELRGTPRQLQQALTYLQFLNITIWGKPNPDGDGWL